MLSRLNVNSGVSKTRFALQIIETVSAMLDYMDMRSAKNT